MNKLITFISGTALGALAAMAFMPKSGKENRKMVKDSLSHQIDKLESGFNGQKDTVKGGYNKRVDGLAKKGHNLVDEIHESAKI